MDRNYFTIATESLDTFYLVSNGNIKGGIKLQMISMLPSVLLTGKPATILW